MDNEPATTPTPNVEMYEPPNTSRLEPHLSFIAELRRCRWPYQRIAERLRTEFGVVIGVSALHEFCHRRGIAKKPNLASGTPAKPRAIVKPRTPGAKAQKVPMDEPSPPVKPDDDPWDFNLSKPRRTWKDEV